MKTRNTGRRSFKMALLLLLQIWVVSSFAQQPIRVVIDGLNHDHIHGILSQYNKGTVTIVGIAETNKVLIEKYSKLYKLPKELFYSDLKNLLLLKKPDAVLAYNAVASHLTTVSVAAPLKIAVMVEKPLAATLQQAIQIEALAKKYNIEVLTNYETTWYASYLDVYNTVNDKTIGNIKKMVVHDGHQGPKEIGCSPEFLNWLTDPTLNGAGALNDFGCYGADLMTWFMKGAKPLAVTAVTRHYKPEVYPKVDDDATILVEYPNATGLVEASWNWPFGIKDLEVFGETGYLHALNGTDIFSRMRENTTASKVALPLAAPTNTPMAYLTAVVQKKIDAKNDQSSLKYNMIVMQILDAAKRSAKEGRRIIL